MELPGSRKQLGPAVQRHRSLTDVAHEASTRRTDSAPRVGRDCLFAHAGGVAVNDRRRRRRLAASASAALPDSARARLQQPPAQPLSRRIRPRRSSRASSPAPRSASGRSTCRRPSTSTSRTRSPASRPPIRASRSSGKTIRAPSRPTSITRSPPASRPTSSTSRSARAGSPTTRARTSSSAQQQRPEGRQGHLLPRPLERAAGQRRELPVPVVPGPQRRADQQEDLQRGRPGRRRLPQEDRRSCRRCARRSRTRPSTLCDIHLTVKDLLSQMVYEGDVDVINDAGTAFTFDSPRRRRLAPDVRRHGCRGHRRQGPC